MKEAWKNVNYQMLVMGIWVFILLFPPIFSLFENFHWKHSEPLIALRGKPRYLGWHPRPCKPRPHHRPGLSLAMAFPLACIPAVLKPSPFSHSTHPLHLCSSAELFPLPFHGLSLTVKWTAGYLQDPTPELQLKEPPATRAPSDLCALSWSEQESVE